MEIEISEIGKFGENDMIELHKSGAGIVKWLLDKSGHDTEELISDCETTIEYLEWLNWKGNMMLSDIFIAMKFHVRRKIIFRPE